MPLQDMQSCGTGRKIATDLRAGYHTAMKRSTRKLAIRRETLRFLTEMEIFRVGGGNAVLVGGGDPCPEMDSGGLGTGCPYFTVTTPKL